MKNQEVYQDKYFQNNFFVDLLIKNFFRSIEDIFETVKVKNVLETAAGYGFSTEKISSFLGDADFQASELRRELVRESQKRNPLLKINQESLYDLKRKDNQFDMVIALEVLEHLKKPELALRELHRVTSCYCLLSVPNEPLWSFLNICRLKYLKNWGNTPDHCQKWSKKKFKKFLSPYFEIKMVKSPLPWIIILAKKKTDILTNRDSFGNIKIVG